MCLKSNRYPRACATIPASSFARAVIVSQLPAATLFASTRLLPAAIATAPRFDEGGGVFFAHPSRRDQLYLRQWSAHILEISRAAERRREHFDDGRPCFPGGQNLGWRQCADHGGNRIAPDSSIVAVFRVGVTMNCARRGSPPGPSPDQAPFPRQSPLGRRTRGEPVRSPFPPAGSCR